MESQEKPKTQLKKNNKIKEKYFKF